ncbi:ankyrin repeat-containing protein ITN1-like [Gastrolobium bilobum]|uniref:ankyrin repeat-containing protein ITN1-like n=1 Tax=Gastrolobium bilobum TaxID=150636 RepID=UPI002AB12751|nr:ankyrin repeat-containing protein ITN1-like [Gastrolobium bilobum]
MAGSLKRDLYAYAIGDIWYRAQCIYDTFPDMVCIPLTATGDTALHVAVSAKSTTFVQELVKHMTPEDLEIPNIDGNTAFCIAAISGIGDFFQIMIEKNKNLPVIPGHDGMLPVHLAALSGHRKIVENLSSEKLLEKMASRDIVQLFFMTISGNMCGVATKLFEKYPANLAIARDDEEKLTALHVLARKSSDEFC